MISLDGYDSADEETQLTANIRVAVAQEERRRGPRAHPGRQHHWRPAAVRDIYRRAANTEDAA